MKKSNKTKWIDVSLPIYNGMSSWPSDPSVEISAFKSIAQGRRSNVSLLKFGSHVGTHMDAPKHVFKDGKSIDALSLESLIGPARVIDIHNPVAITAAELKKHSLCKGQRVLFKTRNSTFSLKKKCFYKDFVYLALDAANFLAKRQVALIGVDYFSIGGYEHSDGIAVHKAILKKDICVVESLNLSSVLAGWYDMICLPLRLQNGDGAPARVVLRKIV